MNALTPVTSPENHVIRITNQTILSCVEELTAGLDALLGESNIHDFFTNLGNQSDFAYVRDWDIPTRRASLHWAILSVVLRALKHDRQTPLSIQLKELFPVD